MLLPTHCDTARKRFGSRFDRGIDVSCRPDARAVFKPAVGGKRLFDGQDRGGFTVCDLSKPGSLACGEVTVSHHQIDGLTQIMHRPIAKQWLVVDRRADVIFKRQIIGGQNRRDTRRGSDGAQVDAFDASTRNRGQAKGQMQAIARGWDVVHIARFASHMQGCAVVGTRGCDAHAETSRTDATMP